MSRWLTLFIILVGCSLIFLLVRFLVHRACKKNDDGLPSPFDIMFIISIEIYIMLGISVIGILFFS